MTILNDIEVAKQLRSLFSRELHPKEIDILVDVFYTNQHGGRYTAGRLGLVESLCLRGWLDRAIDGSVELSQRTKRLLAERAR